MRKLLTTILLCLFCVPLLAQTGSMDKAERISRAVGLEDMLAALQASSLQSAKQQVASLVEQLRKAGLPASNLEKLTPSLERIYSRYMSSWDPKVAGRIYAEGLVESLSEQELVEAERYYASPEGARANKALMTSQQRMLGYVEKQQADVLGAELETFFKEVQKVAAEARKK